MRTPRPREDLGHTVNDKVDLVQEKGALVVDPPHYPTLPYSPLRFFATSAPSCLRVASPFCPAPATPWRPMGPRSCLPVLGKGAAGSQDSVPVDEVGPGGGGASET